MNERSEEEWRHDCMKATATLWRSDGGEGGPSKGGRRSKDGDAFLLNVIKEFETRDAALEVMASYQAAGLECVFLNLFCHVVVFKIHSMVG